MFVQLTSARDRKLVDAVSAPAWTFEEHNDPNLSNWVGSCYHVDYTFYQSFKCDTSLKNCVNGVTYCDTIDDPLDDYTDKTMWYLSIILPSVLGGGLILCCICFCCAAYFGGQWYITYQEKKKRQSRKPRSRK